MTEHKGSNLAIVIKVILGIITIFAIYYGIIMDRAEIVAQVNTNRKDIDEIKQDVQSLKNQKNSLDDIKYNLKRMLEKQGLEWIPFNEK